MPTTHKYIMQMNLVIYAAHGLIVNKFVYIKQFP